MAVSTPPASGLELVRLLHILGILAAFTLGNSQIVTIFAAAALPYLVYSSFGPTLSTPKALSSLIFLSCSLFIAVKAAPLGLGATVMLATLGLLALGPSGSGTRRYKMATIALLLLCVYVVFSLLFAGKSADTVLMFSKNYLSVLGIALFFAAIGEWETSEAALPQWLFIPPLVLCLLSMSLAGLICSAALVFFAAARLFGTARAAVVSGIIVGAVLIVLALISPIVLIGFLRDFFPHQGGWGVLFSGLEDRVVAALSGEGGAERTQIWSTYVDNLNIEAGLLGAPKKDLLEWSLHNSFLTMHMLFGLLSIGLVAAWAMVFSKSRMPGLTMFIVAIVIFRSSVDSILFTGNYFDGLFFMTIRMYEAAPHHSAALSGVVALSPDHE